MGTMEWIILGLQHPNENGVSCSGMDKEYKSQRNHNKWRTPVSKQKKIASSEQDDEIALIHML